MGAPQMCRLQPSTIHRCLDLLYTQIIQTHISHKHNISPPLQTLVQAPYPPTPPQPKQRHTSNTSPVPTGLVKPKPNPLIHSPLSPPSPSRAKYIHISHTSPTPLIPRTNSSIARQLRETQYLDHVYLSHAMH